MDVLTQIGYMFTPEFIAILIGVIILFVSIIIIYKVIKRMKGKTRKSLLFKDFNVGNFMVIMFRKIGDKYHEIDRKRINVTQNTFRYNHKDFVGFDMKNVLFSDKKNNYYGFDYDTGEQLNFHIKGMPKIVSIEDIDMYVNRNIIKNIVAGLEELKPKGQYLMLIVGIVLGLAIGIIIGMYVSPTVGTPVQTPPITTPILPPYYGGN